MTKFGVEVGRSSVMQNFQCYPKEVFAPVDRMLPSGKDMLFSNMPHVDYFVAEFVLVLASLVL